MAIIGFWSGSEKETGQTISIVSLAAFMGVNHNYKLLLIDATYDDDTLSRCFWNVNNQNSTVRKLNGGKIDIATGAEGLVSAVASNKATPEIITNFTWPIYTGGKLDVLAGLKTKVQAEFTKSLMLYKDLLQAANKYYDIVLVDLEKTLKRETTKYLLDASHIIVYTFSQNRKQIEEFNINMHEHADILQKDKVIPLLGNADPVSKYNARNITRMIGERREIPSILYNPVYKEIVSEAGVSNFFIRKGIIDPTQKRDPLRNDTDGTFVKSIEYLDKCIDMRLEELKYKV